MIEERARAHWRRTGFYRRLGRMLFGAGSADERYKVFERFYRVDRARSRETGGTGLGLAIVRHVATNHAGDVRVDSREGEGSTFTLRLPVAGGATDERPQAG